MNLVSIFQHNNFRNLNVIDELFSSHKEIIANSKIENLSYIL
jgi:hypothetical protein